MVIGFLRWQRGLRPGTLSSRSLKSSKSGPLRTSLTPPFLLQKRHLGAWNLQRPNGNFTRPSVAWPLPRAKPLKSKKTTGNLPTSANLMQTPGRRFLRILESRNHDLSSQEYHRIGVSFWGKPQASPLRL